MIVVLLFAVGLIVSRSRASHCHQNVTETGMFYYNPGTGVPLCGEITKDDERDQEEKIEFRRLPCSCENLTCGCCAGMHFESINFDRRACANLTYEPLNFAIEMEVTMNENRIFKRRLSAKNPPPLCIPVPYLPFLDFCIRLYNVYTPGRNLHACIDFEARVARSPVLILHFDCIRIGADGIAWLKPEDNGGWTDAIVVEAAISRRNKTSRSAKAYNVIPSNL